jgi:excisionase family DNA binding protein
MPNNEEEIWDPIEVAQYMKVPLATLYAWRYKGEGPLAHRIGRHLRYRRRDVEEWFDAQK